MTENEDGSIRIPKWAWAALGSATVLSLSFMVGAISWSSRIEKVLTEASTRLSYIQTCVDRLAQEQDDTSERLNEVRAQIAINSGRLLVLEDRARRTP